MSFLDDGKCPSCGTQILARGPDGSFARTLADYRNTYIVVEGGGMKSKMKVPACINCIDNYDYLTVYEKYRNDPSVQYYDSYLADHGITFAPTGTERYR